MEEIHIVPMPAKRRNLDKLRADLLLAALPELPGGFGSSPLDLMAEPDFDKQAEQAEGWARRMSNQF